MTTPAKLANRMAKIAPIFKRSASGLFSSSDSPFISHSDSSAAASEICRIKQSKMKNVVEALKESFMFLVGFYEKVANWIDVCVIDDGYV